ncbi:hypothetical protein HPB49_007762 [Dermacentor silvarum]|uniref:Uncharacterized protein n=1 Tax=Dermacentor silvarum TaxID=543639 RepID=A0ACB8DIJ9_DERSI|nr:hypothetical protein HPB49_007762 [Dermacentor silvarum]
MWMRLPDVRKGRECIMPLWIVRAEHNSYFQDVYFKKHAFNTQPAVQLKEIDSVKKENYEQVIHDLLRRAIVLDHSKSPCEENFIPDTKGEVYVMFFKINGLRDFSTWLQIAKSMWRLFMKGNHLLIVGVPNSTYSSFKPAKVPPIYLEGQKIDKDRL